MVFVREEKRYLYTTLYPPIAIYFKTYSIQLEYVTVYDGYI